MAAAVHVFMGRWIVVADGASATRPIVYIILYTYNDRLRGCQRFSDYCRNVLMARIGPAYSIGETRDRAPAQKKAGRKKRSFLPASAVMVVDEPSLTFPFTNAFLDSGQFLFQLVPVVLQAFPFLLGGEEPAESCTASASATTAGASRQSAGFVGHFWLTHRNHLLSGYLCVSVHSVVPVCLVDRTWSLIVPRLPWRRPGGAIPMS